MTTPKLDEAAIFNVARQMAVPEERRLYVQQACAAHPVLQARIEAMLRLQDQDPSFLEPPGDDRGAAASPAPDLGAQIGPYTLIRKIGEGGMGTVFLAEQSQPVKRTVAIKIIKPGMDSRRVIARFEAERQALALMDHPNIAKVLDAGATGATDALAGSRKQNADPGTEIFSLASLFSGGRPYFVMELVNGVPITKYCDEQRLTPRERLELFIPVCQAVQHAHQKGIIHRDLKPSNVLIALYDGKPVPKIIDFGVAKAVGSSLTEWTELTEFGSVIGTLEYMSPEQAEPGQPDIDTRSDIYSLGALLYELLTGTTPLQPKRLHGAALLELLRIVREEEPPVPSLRLSTTEELPSIAANRRLEPKKLSGLVRGDLDWIVMKCLEKNRTRRYETANGLARDIERYLNDEVVEACPPSAGYRIRKFARKYKKALVTVGAFAVLLVTATVVSLGLASWALQERKQAEGQKQLAESNFKKALKAVDQMLTRVGEAQLLNVPQMEPVRRDLLQDALRFYQEFLRERNDSPLVRSEAASAYKRMGSILVLLGNRDEGEEAYRQAVVLLEQLLAQSPGDPVLGNKLAGVHIDLGLLYHTTQRWPKAEASLQRAVSILDKLANEHPSLLMNRVDLAKSHLSLVLIYRQMGNLNQGEQEFRKSMSLLDSLLASDPTNLEYLTLKARCYQKVALVYGAQGHTAEAKSACQESLAINQRLVRDQPDVVDHQKTMAETYNNLGLFYARDRQHDKADAAYKQSLALNEAILHDHPKVVDYIVDVGGSYTNMATHVRRTRSPAESLEWSAKAIRLLEPVLQQDPRDVRARMYLFDVFMGRGQALLQMKRLEEARKDWRKMVELSAGQSHISMRLFRPAPLARLGDHLQATAEIETLLKEGSVQGLNLYTFAYAYSLSSSAAANDARLPPAERNKLADKYGRRSVELLSKARATGYFQNPGRLAHMKEDDDLDAIRDRADFKKLLVDVDAEKAKESK